MPSEKMKKETGVDGFKVMPWLREVRDQINAEMADMSYEELSQWLKEGVREDPLLADIPIARNPARSCTEAATHESGSEADKRDLMASTSMSNDAPLSPTPPDNRNESAEGEGVRAGQPVAYMSRTGK